MVIIFFILKTFMFDGAMIIVKEKLLASGH